MAKFHGIIGFATSVEKSPGVWGNTFVEQTYTGDVIRNSQRWNASSGVNPDVNVSDTISIVADAATISKMHSMKYVMWRGEKLAIVNVRSEHPRVIIDIGGLFNG